MTRIALTLAAALFASSAQGWTLVSENSAINYVSIKNGEVAEANLLPGLTGSVDDSGQAEIIVDLASVQTYIEQRDERMREHLFRVSEFPTARIAAQIDMAPLEALAPGDSAQAEFEVTVAANGAESAYPVKAQVSRLSEDRVAVMSYEPVIIDAEDLNYQGGIEKLREIAGLDSIQLAVPVGFTLVFQR